MLSKQSAPLVHNYKKTLSSYFCFDVTLQEIITQTKVNILEVSVTDEIKNILNAIINIYENRIKKLDKDYGLLPQKYIDKLPFNYHDKINKVKDGFKLNQIFFNKITSLYSPKFDYINLSPNFYEDRKYSDIYLLHGFFIDCLIRDWSIEGKEERELSYGKIITELKKKYLHLRRQDR